MTTAEILDAHTNCYECDKPFNADQWAFHHDQHPDWCVVEHGASCDCNESFPVHEHCCFACNGSLFDDPHAEERGHRFFPRQSVLDEIPSLYQTEKLPIGDRTVHLHYFSAAADFWIVELDQGSGTAFGYVCLGDPAMAEWGVMYLPELQDLYVPFKLGPGTITPPLIVERDLWWTPKPASECKLPGRGVSL